MGALIVSLAVSAGCRRHPAGQVPDGNADSVSVALPGVMSVTLGKTYPGYLSAADEVELVSRVSGRLVSAPYKPGPVGKGDVLFVIDSTPYADAVARAEAALESAVAERDYARIRLKALQKALEADAVSRMEVVQAESNLRQLEASIKTARAELADARANLDHCTVRAPFSGRVAKRNVDPGAIIQPGTSLSTIFSDDRFSINFHIEDENFIAMLRQGGSEIDSARIPVSFGEKMPHDYFARMSYVAPNVDTSTGTYLMQASLDNTYGELRSGMYVTIDLPYARMDSALVVEAAAVGTDQRGEYLYTVTDSNTVAYTRIVTGQNVGDSLRVVTSGLGRGVPYVTKALLKVRPGERIVPVMTE